MISTSIVSFEENAFNSPTFHALKSLTIDTQGDFVENTLALTKESFIGLKEIEKLEIIRIPQINVDSNQSEVFKEISPTIVEMTIANSNLIFLRRLFENSTFEKLEKLNLTGNSFQNSTTNIASSSFTGVHGCLKKLYMSDSRIESIHFGTFDNFEQLEELDLQRNSLQFLPVGIFDAIKKTNPDFKVYLENNNWNCMPELCHLTPFASENVYCAYPDSSSTILGFCSTLTTPLQSTLDGEGKMSFLLRT
jgi:hypothetical protein